MYQYSFEKLNVWQDARLLVKEVYTLLSKFPKEEKFALCDQLKRAAISIASNIAEGTSRSSYREKIRFIEMSYGSLMEVYSQIILSEDLGYLDNNSTQMAKELIFKISNELSALKKSYNNNVQ